MEASARQLSRARRALTRALSRMRNSDSMVELKTLLARFPLQRRQCPYRETDDEDDETILEFGQELSEDFPAIAFTNLPVAST